MTSWRAQVNVSVAAWLLVAGLLSMPGAMADPPPPPSAAPVHVTAGTETTGIDVHLPPTGFGSISGRVLESGSGKRLGDIQVEAYVPPHRFVDRASTGPDGTYRLRLPAYARGYLICFRRDPLRPDAGVGGTSTTGWAPECLGNRVWAGGDPSVPSDTKRVRVRTGQETRHVSASLRAGGVLTGRVARHASGAGLDAARVYVRSVGAPHYRKRFYTDQHGRYRIANLPFAARGYQVCFDTRNENHPDNEASHPVVPRCYGGAAWRSMPQTANGQSIPSIPDWSTVHWPRAASRVVVHSGSVRRGIGVQVRPAGAITGRVVNRSDGSPANVSWVVAFDDHGRIIGRSVVSDQRGGFKISWLPSSDVHVCVDPTRYYGGWDTSYQRMCYRHSLWTDTASTANGTAVHVVRGRTNHGVVLRVPHASTIEGRLTSAAGAPVVGIVTLFTSGGRRLAQTRTGTWPNAVENQYAFRSVPASRAGYVLCATDIHTGPTDPDLGPRCYTHGHWDGAPDTAPKGAKPVRVGAHDHLHGIDIALPAGAAISGAVTPTGGPHHHLFERLTLFDQHGHRVHDPDGTIFRGTWAVSGLDPSYRYRVCFEVDAKPFAARPTCYSNVRWYRP